MRSQLAVLALAIAVWGPIEATAEGDRGIYGGLSAGLAQTPGGDCPAGAQCDDQTWGYRAFGGYQFNRYIGAEFGYDYLGRYDSSGTAGSLTLSQQTKVGTLDLTAVARLPLGDRFSIFAKGGAAWYIVEGTANTINSANGATASASTSANGWSPTYGLGASWQPWERHGSYAVAFRLEWQRFQDVGDQNTTGQSNVDFYSLSVVLF